MNKLPETVAAKFSELFVTLHTATDELKIAGAEANLIGDFSQVTHVNDLCLKLQALDAEIKSIVNNFDTKYNVRSSQKMTFRKKNRNRTRSPNSRLRVKVADQVIEEQTIKDTFVRTLQVFGLNRVAKLNKTISNAPLIARTPVNGYQNQKQCDGWYVTTHVNKHNASAMLKEIGKELNMPVKFEGC